jgi:hypothetical protein
LHYIFWLICVYALSDGSKAVSRVLEELQLFGPKAFKPMLLAGAMSGEVDAFKRDIAMILRKHGRQGWLLDRPRFEEEKVPRKSMVS